MKILGFLKSKGWTPREILLTGLLVVVIAVACAPTAHALLNPEPMRVEILNESPYSHDYGVWTWQKLTFIDPETGTELIKKCLVWNNKGFRLGGPAYCE